MAIVTNNALSRSLGSLEARMDSSEERLRRMEEKIDTLVETVAQSKGGLRTLIAAGSVIAGITATVASIATWLLGRHS